MTVLVEQQSFYSHGVVFTWQIQRKSKINKFCFLYCLMVYLEITSYYMAWTANAPAKTDNSILHTFPVK